MQTMVCNRTAEIAISVIPKGLCASAGINAGQSATCRIIFIVHVSRGRMTARHLVLVVIIHRLDYAAVAGQGDDISSVIKTDGSLFPQRINHANRDAFIVLEVPADKLLAVSHRRQAG